MLATARFLAENPGDAVPVCEANCVFLCPFKKARREIAGIHANHEDLAKLTKASKKGGTMARAYAGTVRLAAEGKLPYLANFRVAGATIPYALRGGAKPIALVGYQHHRRPHLRLLASAEAVRNRGLHVYAVGDGSVCTAKAPRAPAAFVEEAMDRIGLTRTGSNAPWTCGHPVAFPAIAIEWKSASTTLRICETCVGEGNTISRILEHAAGPKLRADFAARVELPPLPDLPEGATHDDATARAAYAKGALTDAAFIAQAKAGEKEALAAHEGRILIAAGITYPDPTAFVAALDATDRERIALEAALEEWDKPLILDRASAARALAEIWEERGEAAVRAVAGDADIASRLFDPMTSPSAIGGVLAKAEREGKRIKVEAALPSFDDLPGPVALVDRASRLMRHGERDGVIRLAESEKREKATGLAILMALDASAQKEWQYSNLDLGMATDLKPHVKRTLTCKPEEYEEALHAFATAAGSTIEFSSTG